MKIKHYVIPVYGKTGYLAIKAELNPYNNKHAYCGGCPQAFGGNRDGKETFINTLCREMREESHEQLNVVSMGIDDLKKVHDCTVGTNHMEFWIYQSKNPLLIHPRTSHLKNNHTETTGELLKIDFRHVPITDKKETVDYLLRELEQQFERKPLRKNAENQFRDSETAEAIRKVASIVQAESFAVRSTCVLI